MTDLEPRLEHLRETPVPAGPSAADVRTRAIRRRARRHRRTLLATVPVVVALVVGAAVLAADDDPSQSVITGNDPTTTPTASTSTTAAGTSTTDVLDLLPGVTIGVSPTEDLRDGQLISVDIEGLDEFSSPAILLCAADVEISTGASDCDASPLEFGGSSEGATALSATQEVVVRRVIRLPRLADEQDDQAGDYDCATEPVGCALVVGNTVDPIAGVGIAVTFADEGLADPMATAMPATGLSDRQVVDVRATGLRPNTTYVLTQCSTGPEPVCDEMTLPTAKSDANGDLLGNYPATAAIYGWKGRADCTAEPCGIQVRTERGSDQEAIASIRFAADVVAPVPRLEISPAGPYEDQQVVTVTGSGFPIGLEIGGEIGQCPNDKDTAVEERCGYATSGPGGAVDDEGRFTIQVRLFRNGACSQPAGCHLGWVINHGPTLAKVPLEFR